MLAEAPARVWIPDWPLPDKLRCFVSLRAGLAPEPYGGFNMAAHVGDDADCVAANRRQLRALLPGNPTLNWLEQIHGNSVVDRPLKTVLPPRADAQVTRYSGEALMIMVADCAPVLFSSRCGTVLGAAHAGWRGLCSGVLPATVAAMAVPPQQLTAWVGPRICAHHYEVGDEVKAAFLQLPEAGEVVDAICRPASRQGHFHFDLAAAVVWQLRRLGVLVTDSGVCSRSDPQRFYSFRGSAVTGRNACGIYRQT